MKKGWTFLELLTVIGITGVAASVLLPLHTKRIRLGRTQMMTQQIKKIYSCIVRENKSSQTNPIMPVLVNDGLISSVNNMFSYPYSLSYNNHIVTITTDVPKDEVSSDFPPEIQVTEVPNNRSVWQLTYSNNLPFGNRQTEMFNWFFVGQRS
ncbi:MAG: hypothetical protein M1135_02925 [Candidatus Omnitrophica bacterium]|nr:hypothetical protein [Candidatus Omnitrophota bacterium]